MAINMATPRYCQIPQPEASHGGLRLGHTPPFPSLRGWIQVRSHLPTGPKTDHTLTPYPVAGTGLGQTLSTCRSSSPLSPFWGQVGVGLPPHPPRHPDGVLPQLPQVLDQEHQPDLGWDLGCGWISHYPFSLSVKKFEHQ